MPSNSQIRTVQLAQGVDVTLPISVLDETDTIDLSNNVSNTHTGLQFDLAVYRSVLINYSLRRRTDSTTGLIQTGVIELISNPDGVGAAKWTFKHDFEDEGTTPGITFEKNVVGDVVDLDYDSTNIAGTNHHCYFSYELTSFLV